jgi:CRP-like cAMP-binding protein
MRHTCKPKAARSASVRPICAGPWIQSVRLHRSLLRCVHDFLIQTAQTAVANGRSKLEERLARWLLMANDRIDGPEVPLTHKFLAVMLGAHRPFVTLTVQALERKGLIRAGRQVITIIDRKRPDKTV